MVYVFAIWRSRTDDQVVADVRSELDLLRKAGAEDDLTQSASFWYAESNGDVAGCLTVVFMTGRFDKLKRSSGQPGKLTAQPKGTVRIDEVLALIAAGRATPVADVDTDVYNRWMVSLHDAPADDEQLTSVVPAVSAPRTGGRFWLYLSMLLGGVNEFDRRAYANVLEDSEPLQANIMPRSSAKQFGPHRGDDPKDDWHRIDTAVDRCLFTTGKLRATIFEGGSVLYGVVYIPNHWDAGDPEKLSDAYKEMFTNRFRKHARACSERFGTTAQILAFGNVALLPNGRAHWHFDLLVLVKDNIGRAKEKLLCRELEDCWRIQIEKLMNRRVGVETVARLNPKVTNDTSYIFKYRKRKPHKSETPGDLYAAFYAKESDAREQKRAQDGLALMDRFPRADRAYGFTADDYQLLRVYQGVRLISRWMYKKSPERTGGNPVSFPAELAGHLFPDRTSDAAQVEGK